MLSILAIAILCLQLLLSGTAAEEPGLKVRLTSQGFDYLGQVAVSILNKEIQTIKIPDIHQGSINVSDIRVIQYHSPTSQVSLQPASTIGWALNGAGIDLAAQVRACKRIFGKNVCESVSVEINAKDIGIQASAAFGRNPDDQELPTILAADCKTVIGKMDFNFKGGVVGWILDLFKSLISHELKPKIELMVCDETEDLLLVKVNEKLAALPVDIKIAEVLDLDFGLVSDPTIDTSHLELDLNGKVTDLASPSIVSPYPPTPLVEQIQDDRMAYASISDKVINDFFYMAQEANLTRFLCTQDTPVFGPYLTLHCDTICLGSLIPNVTELYPDVKAAESLMATTKAPVIIIDKDGSANVSVDVSVDIYTPTTPKSQIFLATISVETAVKLAIENMLLVGNVKIGKLDLDIITSQLDPEIMQFVVDHLQTMIVPLIEKDINNKLSDGVALPVIQNVTLNNSQIRLLDRTVQLETDVAFTA